MNHPLINWNNKDEVINTQYGWITYQDWCEREIQRIKRKGLNLVVRLSKCCVMEGVYRDPAD